MTKDTEHEVKGLFPGGVSILLFWGLALLIGMIVMIITGG
jgi:hypothetical protein